jgi:uncharacterized protein YceH (UPF0502 family)
VPVDLSAPEIRVLGCLLEKQRTTPDAYPLSLNALRLACNQATNRDPVTEYDEAVIRDALHRLSRRRWTRLASGAGSRAPKYRHLLDEALGLPEDELAVLCVLMLRGPQTPGELKQRTERLHPLADLSAVLDALERLIGRDLAERLPRRPGQKEERYTHLLGDDEDQPGAPAAPAGPAREWAPSAAAPEVEDASAAPPPSPVPAPPAAAPPPDPLVARLEDEVAALRTELAALRASLDALRADLGA